MGKILICIPTYNEKENILAIIQKIFFFLPKAHVLVVDDNSSDGTAKLVEESEFYKKSLFLIKRSGKKGLGRAYLEGFSWAIKENYQVVFQCDADFSHNPKYLPFMLEELEKGADLVIGSRNIPGGGVENWSFFRRTLSRFGSFYARSILLVSIQDLTGGFNGYRVAVLKAMDLQAIRSNGYVFQIELKYRASLLGFRLLEFPIVFKDRVHGVSKMNFKIVLEAFWHVIYLRLFQQGKTKK